MTTTKLSDIEAAMTPDFRAKVAAELLAASAGVAREETAALLERAADAAETTADVQRHRASEMLKIGRDEWADEDDLAADASGADARALRALAARIASKPAQLPHDPEADARWDAIATEHYPDDAGVRVAADPPWLDAPDGPGEWWAGLPACRADAVITFCDETSAIARSGPRPLLWMREIGDEWGCASPVASLQAGFLWRRRVPVVVPAAPAAAGRGETP